MINQTNQQQMKQAIRGFSWFLIVCEELLLFIGLLGISFFASSDFMYILDATIFLTTLSLLEIILTIAVLGPQIKFKERLLASFYLLPSWQNIVALVTIVRLAIALLILGIVIWMSHFKINPFPNYWWDVGYRFLLVSVDLSVLFPVALKTIASQNKGRPNLQKFLISEIILTLGWVGGFIDWGRHISPPQMIVISSWVALFIALLILYSHQLQHQKNPNDANVQTKSP
jgi:hypothetical protein